jgi:hypothetical protein
MLKVGQGLSLQQSPKHPDLVRRFLHGHQVLNVTEGYHPLDRLLWALILEDSKLLGVLGGWVVRIHEELKLDPLRVICVRPIKISTLSIFFTLETKGMGEGFLRTEGGKAAEDLETYPLELSRLKIYNRSVIKMLYVERTSTICDIF